MMTTNTDNKTAFEKKVDARLPQIRKFIVETITTNEFRDEQEFWAQFDDEIDVQFSEDDDDASPFFGTMNFYAYPLVKNENGQTTTDTSEYVLISGS